MPLKAASWFPAAHCLMGFKAQTYPVTSENIDTPIRPCTSIRTIGYWRNRGAACSRDVGLKRSSSKARARCVKTTRRDAMPRRPYDQVIVLVEAFLRAGIVEGDWGGDLGESAKALLTSTHFTFSCRTLILPSPIYTEELYTCTKRREAVKTCSVVRVRDPEKSNIGRREIRESYLRRWNEEMNGLSKSKHLDTQ